MHSSLCKEIVDFGTKKSNPRNGVAIKKVTIHHMAGKQTGKKCALMHRDGSREASANYYIGYDGEIVGGVDETRRSWCSSSRENDYQAITIEVSNETCAPTWTISAKAYDSLIALCADICRRYGIVPAYNGTKNASFTEHRMFVATLCPGPYIHDRMSMIVADIQKALKPAEPVNTNPTQPKVIYRVQVGAFTVKKNADNIAKKLQEKGYPVIIKKEDKYYRVQVGAFAVKKNADEMAKKLKADGYSVIVKKGE